MYLEEVKVGDRLQPVERRPSNIQLFRFSAVTWNAHRIHYDRDYAMSEGYPDILVQSHLHGCFLSETVLNWAGDSGILRRFRWENRHFAVPGDVLTCDGEVTAIVEGETCGYVDLKLTERNQDGVVCAPGWATVELPRRNGHT